MPDTVLIHLASIDSTNNYAMQLLDAEAAGAGTLILADAQTRGKGQRGQTWLDVPGQNLLMSAILQPGLGLDQQFRFSAAVAVQVAAVLEALEVDWTVAIKWPNDIIINDKKAGGILIENVIRGSQWVYAVVGFGMNVLQDSFDPALPNATSLLRESGRAFEVRRLAEMVGARLMELMPAAIRSDATLEAFNARLHRRGALQDFADAGREWTATVERVHPDGTLEVSLADGSRARYTHGAVQWRWR